jgi:DNA-binding NtrC family response regulator
VQRWVALCEGVVAVHDLSPAIVGRGDEAADPDDPDDLRIRPRVDKLERELIERALEQTSGNQTRAAERLGLSRYGLQKKLRRLSEDAGDGA